MSYEQASKEDVDSTELNNRILQARAEKLAQYESASKQAFEYRVVVEFLLSNQRYAFEIDCLREVYPLRDVTRIPCVPPHIVGVVNLRGQVITVLDLRSILRLNLSGPLIFNKAIVVENAGVSVAFLADEILETRALELGDIQDNPRGLTDSIATYAAGVTSDGVIILDTRKILTDPNLIVR